MSRKIKEMLEGELKTRYSEIPGALVVDVSKLSGTQANQMRGKLRGKGIEVHVVKNRSARRAMTGSSLASVGKALSGPCALVTSKKSIIDVAKDLIELVKEFPLLALKGGVVEGVPDYLPVETVAKMRGRLEVLGDVAGAAAAPGRKIAGCLKSAGGKIAGCLKAIADKPAAAA